VTGLSRHAPSTAPAGRHLVCDLGDARRAAEVIGAIRPDAVIHTQALSDVDRCEREPEAARAQNVDATAHLIQALRQERAPGDGGRGALLVHISTDYVFDGAKGAPYIEEDEPRPLSVYGRSKLEAERLALGYPRAVVVRPSTLFGPGRMNFCDHIVSRVRAGEAVEAFADQVTSPTYTEDLAAGLGELCAAVRGLPDGSRPRLVHLANAGGCSRVAFAERVADLLEAVRGFTFNEWALEVHGERLFAIIGRLPDARRHELREQLFPTPEHEAHASAALAGAAGSFTIAL